MSQIIDLRKKNSPPEITKPVIQAPPAPTVEPVVKIEPPVLPETSHIKWSVHLSPPHRRDRIMYATVAFVIAAVLVAYFARDFLFTTVLILSAVVLNLNAFKPRRQSEISVHATGVSIDNQHHHYADMKSFWIDYQSDLKELSIEMKKGYTPRIKIPLEDTDPLEIRRAMVSYVPEKEHEQSLLDQIIRLIGM
jgi:hypothetical protein